MSAADRSPIRQLAMLLQMASPLLPVGAFAYSQGIEHGVHDGRITSAVDAQRWITDTLGGPIARFEAPVWLRLYRATAADDADAFDHWNERFIASRETSELRAETLQMGASLASWACELRLPVGESLRAIGELAFPAAFAACAATLRIGEQDGLAAYVWSWIENQVTAAMKAVPLGQVAGQRLLLAAHEALDEAVHTAMRLHDDELVSAAPGLTLACALHEVQYSRLFRS
jgi:urease accessory protein